MSKVKGETPLWLSRPALGNGYVSEAVGAFLANAKAGSGLAEVEADHFADNAARARVIQKLGFVAAGTGMGRSPARLEPAPVVVYRLKLGDLKACP